MYRSLWLEAVPRSRSRVGKFEPVMVTSDEQLHVLSIDPYSCALLWFTVRVRTNVFCVAFRWETSWSYQWSTCTQYHLNSIRVQQKLIKLDSSTVHVVTAWEFKLAGVWTDGQMDGIWTVCVKRTVIKQRAAIMKIRRTWKNNIDASTSDDAAACLLASNDRRMQKYGNQVLHGVVAITDGYRCNQSILSSVFSAIARSTQL